MIRGSIWKSNIQLIGLPGKRKTLKIQKEGRKEGGRERKKEKERKEGRAREEKKRKGKNYLKK